MPRRQRQPAKPSRRAIQDREVRIAKEKDRELQRELAKMGPFTGEGEGDIDPDETSEDDPQGDMKDPETGT